MDTDPNPVEVEVALDPDTGVVTCTFTCIDPVTGQLVADPLEVVGLEHHGERVLAEVLLPGTAAALAVPYPADRVPRPGSAAEVRVRADRLAFFDPAGGGAFGGRPSGGLP